jgi:hypothetical protein
MSDLFPKNIVPLEASSRVRFLMPPSEGLNLTLAEGVQPTNLTDVPQHPAQQGQVSAQSPSNDPATTSLSKARRKKTDKKKEKKFAPGTRPSKRNRSASATPQPIRITKAKSTEDIDVSIKEPLLSGDDGGSSSDEPVLPPPIYQTKGTRFVGDAGYRDLVAERQRKAAERKELKQELHAKMSRGQRVQAALITGAKNVVDLLINGPAQKETAKGNAYGVHGAMTDVRAGGLVGTQVPDAGPMSSVVYGGFGIGAAATGTYDIYAKFTAWKRYTNKLNQLEGDLGKKERALQILILEKEAVDGSGEAQRALNEYRLQDQLLLSKKEKRTTGQGKPWEPPVAPPRERDKYGPTPTPAQLKAALKVEITAATKARDAAKTALKTHADTLVKEWLKFLRDILAQSGTSATSTAWGLHTLSLVVDITVNIVDIALLPVMGGLSTVTGTVDQYDSRKDRNAAQANFSKAMQKVLVATEALGHYEKVVQDLENNGTMSGPVWRIALQNRNAAEVALRNANRVLRELIRKLNVADLRELKGRIYQSGGLAVLVGGVSSRDELTHLVGSFARWA